MHPVSDVVLHKLDAPPEMVLRRSIYEIHISRFNVQGSVHISDVTNLSFWIYIWIYEKNLMGLGYGFEYEIILLFL